MDFLRNRATLAGRDTHKKQNIRDLANHAKPIRGQGGDTRNIRILANHAKPSKSAKRQASPPRQNLKTSKSR